MSALALVADRAAILGFVAADLAAICGKAGDRTPQQVELHQLLTAFALDPRVPPDVAARLGRVVWLANSIGMGNP